MIRTRKFEVIFAETGDLDHSWKLLLKQVEHRSRVVRRQTHFCAFFGQQIVLQKLRRVSSRHNFFVFSDIAAVRVAQQLHHQMRCFALRFVLALVVTVSVSVPISSSIVTLPR